MWAHISNSAEFDDRRTVMQIAAYPNMLEGLAGMYNRDMLDERIVKTRVEIAAQSFRAQADWWIDVIRSPASATDGGRVIFEEIDEMLRRLAAIEHPSPYNP
ncbi:MAG TPA: hypothetical protein VG188_02760 [Solirubrobacteraceae bacterium]|jgi:hypothetical protein|nr:hypothetical protein [Solirubrobacteraceae bacterium]